ncbi:uncharacterized protein LOC116301131 [Actinia tenebrosa]|uniref:Uncharacterized protein LOC116301131 n=1 Tax=Actinia tenebrosa TaxID=6105 RepID=A0A6P8IGP9_ACTTE|nr:uncharacterized protein LOC116301131 [Actinia tenebrosa]
MQDEDIDDFVVNQKAQNTVKATETVLRRLALWHKDRYGEDLDFLSITKENSNKMLKHFFMEIRDTRKQSAGKEYEPSTLTTYPNTFRRYFLERKEGERFDIGEDQDLSNKLASKRKQLKSAGKVGLPNQCHALDDQQIEKLWTSGAVGTKTSRQLLHLVWWNNIRVLGMRARQEQLDCRMEKLFTIFS